MKALRTLLASTIIGLSWPVSAEPLIPERQAAALIERTHQNFWGTAKLSNGQLVQPKDEKDRKTLPIPHPEAVRIVQASAPAGLAAWCELDWETYYLAFMKKERTKRWSQVQLAFVGMLFGVSQGALEQSLASSSCATKDRERVSRLIAEAMKAL